MGLTNFRYDVARKPAFRFALGLLFVLVIAIPTGAQTPVTIYLAGDSTMAQKLPEKRPETGWGEALGQFFREHSVRIDNRAKNGRSTRTFISEGLWQGIIDSLHQSDFVFIQFGHNDESKEKTDRYTPPADYRANLIRFVNEVRAKKALPVLLTPVMRRRFDEHGAFFDTHGEYPDIVRTVARDYRVPLIDMHRKSEEVLKRYGSEPSRKLFLQLKPGENPNYPNGIEDNTHFSPEGAEVMAQLAVDGIRALRLPLAKLLKPTKRGSSPTVKEAVRSRSATNGFANPTRIVVALDGSGNFKSVQEAIMSVPAATAQNPVVIRIKPGTYRELIYVQREKRFFRLIGEDASRTVLTYNLNANMIGSDGKPIGTFRTPSTQIDADDFVAENITFENSAGPVGQALAIRVDGDRVVFRNCRFLGWQDTILLNRGRQYFENCYIEGHVDFIFGAATAWFERCHIHSLRDGYITAASTPSDVAFGFVFSHCEITGPPNVKSYLGRPWRTYAAVTFLNTAMSDVVRPEGWHNWNLPEREKTVRYGEFASAGAGANARARVAWAKQLSKLEARAITIGRVLGGSDRWNPKVP
jgi:pectinesterase